MMDFINNDAPMMDLVNNGGPMMDPVNDGGPMMDQINTNHKQYEATWSSAEEVGNGIWVYHNTVKPELDIINRLENVLSDESTHYGWQEAFVGYRQRMPEYRDCVDFKFKKSDIAVDQSHASKKLQDIWQDCYDAQYAAVQDYCKKYNVHNLRYWEAFNFIRYGEGQHFQEHHDHGYSYNCTVSLVTYLNDDYEGGEIFFRLQGLNYKPKAGDTVIFPSNFMYPHTAKVVTKGIKYSLVTMLDYSDKYHKPEFYQETGS